FHQLHQRPAMLRANRSEADAAIAEHRGGDAVPARRPEQRVPHRLPVVMRVHVDPAGRHQQPRGVDLAPSRTLLASNACGTPSRDGHVAGNRGAAGTIDNGTAANDDVVHRSLLESWKPKMMHLPQTRCNARVDRRLHSTAHFHVTENPLGPGFRGGRAGRNGLDILVNSFPPPGGGDARCPSPRTISLARPSSSPARRAASAAPRPSSLPARAQMSCARTSMPTGPKKPPGRSPPAAEKRSRCTPTSPRAKQSTTWYAGRSTHSATC